MAVMVGAGVAVLGSVSVGASVMQLGTTSTWTITTGTLISMRVWLQSQPAIPVPVPVVVSGMMPCVPSPVSCRCALWWHSIWTICCYVAILITLKAMHVKGIMCNVAQFLTLKALISSLVIKLIVEEGNRVAVNCWVAWSFSTSLMASVRVWGPFS